MTFNKVSLLDRIIRAKSTASVTKLLNESKGYEYASTKTLRRIKEAAAAKVKELKE